MADLRKRQGDSRKLAKQVSKHQEASGGGKGRENPKGKGKGTEEDWAYRMDDEDEFEEDEPDQDWAKELNREIDDYEEQIQRIVRDKVERMPLKIQLVKKESQVQAMRWKFEKTKPCWRSEGNRWKKQERPSMRWKKPWKGKQAGWKNGRAKADRSKNGWRKNRPTRNGDNKAMTGRKGKWRNCWRRQRRRRK